MSRYKTFVSTGIAPDGRLYAGDLNGMQDLATPLSDFNTVLDVGTLRVGDPTLQLLKYGAGEFRMSGHLRVDGILRPLGGTLPGQYTTAQRDAIPVGRRPFGLIIFNLTTNRYEYNAGTDASPNWQSLAGTSVPAHASTHLPGGSDPLPFSTLVNMAGTRAAKPAAGSSNNGLFYFETDWQQTWRSNGSTWERTSMVPRKVNPGDVSGLSALDGDEILVVLGSGVNWRFRYNAAGGAYKWEFLGGPPLHNYIVSVGRITSQSYQDLGGPNLTIPLAGDYNIEYGFRVGRADQPATEDTYYQMSPQIGAVAADDSIAAWCVEEWGMNQSPSASISTLRTGITTNAVVSSRYKMIKGNSSGQPNPFPSDVTNAFLKITPVRVSN